MKKLKNESALVSEALRVGENYVLARKVGAFSATDSAKNKVTFIYRLLVLDKLIQPLPKGEDNERNMRHKLAIWISKQLPKDHELLA